MKINHNLPALQSYNSIRQSSRKLTTSSQRLSTGSKINATKDDASGHAISNKMRRQLSGLEMAIGNSKDGTSIIQTADGYLDEVQSMVQRLRELGVQAANDTGLDEDREKIQMEVSQLLEEIDAITYKAEFNTRKLFAPKGRGTLTSGANPSDASFLFPMSTNVPEGTLNYTVNNVFTESKAEIDISGFVPPSNSQTIIVDGNIITLPPTTDPSSYDRNYIEAYVFTELKGLGYEVSLDKATNKIEITTETGAPAAIGGTAFGGLGLTNAATQPGSLTVISGVTFTLPGGAPVVIPAADIEMGKDKFTLTLQTVPLSTIDIELNKVESTPGNFTLGTVPAGSTINNTNGAVNGNPPQTVEIKDKSFGNIVLQVGANQYMEMELVLPEISTRSLGLHVLNPDEYVKIDTAKYTMEVCDVALERINTIRAKFGAYQNRLESTERSLNTNSESLAKSLSAIADTDMAREMTNYTSLNVSNQAAMSIMSQANQRPQQVLQLIGNR